MVMSIVVTIRHRIVAFEAPLHERRALRQAKHALLLYRRSCEYNDVKFTSYGSVAIQDAELFQFVSFRLSPGGFTIFHTRECSCSCCWLCFGQNNKFRYMTFTRWEDAFDRYLMTEERPRSGVLVLITYRSKILLPLCMASSRRAVNFVNAVVALVTANAYFSTLVGGQFLFRHVNQSKLLSKVHIGISMGLRDPILELKSKCRVNLCTTHCSLASLRGQGRF
ncbi:hypothetical protein PsorP6_010304 [Peronosclerospora sorghi]|uniref:Uncharacterized protein n=1 Tax=Peronosclerospora sorghi TaxID=230839 RepID=A0ACC0VY48_9STRA|nr:hypothetical protein PsorP6_010304 [Peronosclerospora sorghi]